MDKEQALHQASGLHQPHEGIGAEGQRQPIDPVQSKTTPVLREVKGPYPRIREGRRFHPQR